jgi:CRISPR-associated protein Csd1
VLHVDESGKLMNSWKGKRDEKPDIFHALGQGQKQVDVFVRWRVEIPGDPSSELQYDNIVWQSWINYYLSTRSQKTFCYVTGKSRWQTEQYPRMIRSDNDGAKLVSSNDTSGFTFRGRFTDEQQVCGVDVEIAQKAHSALRWLISRQGKVIKVKGEPQLAIVAWAVSGATVPDPLADSDELLSDTTSKNDAENARKSSSGFTAQDFGIRLSQYLSGYSIKLGATDQIVVMGIDSATPGRMAVTYYRELAGADFLQRIEVWHHGCSWLQRFSKDKMFYGAPAPKDIAQAAYGTKDGDLIKVDDNLQKTTVERLIPCIIDGAPLPWDIVDSCIKKATQRQSLPDWAWQKTLGIACGLYRYYFKKKEDFTMGLDRERKTRDYLYGRLLAVADCMEGYALKLSNEGRQTNATKLMQRFAERPCSTWKTIELALVPYKARLNRNNKYDIELDNIHGLFTDVSGYASDDSLSGEFLLGFHCQRAELFKLTQENTTNKEENANEPKE